MTDKGKSKGPHHTDTDHHTNKVHHSDNVQHKPPSTTSVVTAVAPTIIPLKEVHRFVKDCMVASGVPPEHSDAFATGVVDADYMGHYSFGMNRLEMTIRELRHGVCNSKNEPSILNESPATAWVDGKNTLGMVVGNFCMDLAIKKAKALGVGLVVAKGSNRFGIAGSYSLRAMRQGLVGLSFTNSSPLVAPTRTLKPALGTNPLSISAPGPGPDYFFLDMATSAVAAGKIEMLSKQHLPVPTDWADPLTGVLRPLGGQDPNSNYKGFGLSMTVEILCGILAGGAFGPHIRRYGDFHKVADLSHCFIAIDPSYFAPGFQDRLSDLMNYIRRMEPCNPQKPVLVPGDMEKQHMADVDRQGGVIYLPEILETCEKYAKELKVMSLQHL